MMITFPIEDVIKEASAALALSYQTPLSAPTRQRNPHLEKFETCLPDSYQKVASFFNYQESAILAWLYARNDCIGIRPLESLYAEDYITVANAVFWLTDQ